MGCPAIDCGNSGNESMSSLGVGTDMVILWFTFVLRYHVSVSWTKARSVLTRSDQIKSACSTNKDKEMAIKEQARL